MPRKTRPKPPPGLPHTRLTRLKNTGVQTPPRKPLTAAGQTTAPSMVNRHKEYYFVDGSVVFLVSVFVARSINQTDRAATIILVPR